MSGIYGNCREDKYFEKLLHDYLDSTEHCDDCESHIDDCECDTEKEEYAESENQETELEKAIELAWKEIFRQKEFYGIEPSKFEMVKIACEATLKLKNEDKK